MSRKQNAWIPEHVVDDIIERLPMRSLVRFKCVSNQWNSTISQFLEKNKKLILLSDKSLCIMNYEASTGEATKHSDSKGLGYGYLKILGSCNGLLLISHCHGDFIWNPLTGEKKSLTIHHGIASSALGFGYDYSTNDYKIVSFVNLSSTLERSWSQVYSLRKDSHRILHNIPQGSLIHIIDRVGTLVNNSLLYWLAFNRNHCPIVEDSCSLYWPQYDGVDNNLYLVIFGFNLVSESPMLLQYPSAAVTYANFWNPQLIDYKGSLGVIQTEQETDIEMWVLKEEKHKVNWVKLLSIPRLEVCPLSSVVTVRDDEVLMVYGKKQKLSCGGSSLVENMCLYSYNLTEKTFRKVKVHELKNWTKGIMFSGSMDSLPESMQRGEGKWQ